MALGKTDVSVADTAVAAGTTEGSPVASSAIAVGYGLAGVLRVANGGTGPTIGASVAVQVRPNTSGGSDWRYWAGPFQAGIAASTNYEFPFSVPVEVAEARVIAFGNTGQAVTLNARISRADTL